MEVAQSREGISISQRKYTLDLLKETGITNVVRSIPLWSIVKLRSSVDKIPVDKEKYQHTNIGDFDLFVPLWSSM